MRTSTMFCALLLATSAAFGGCKQAPSKLDGLTATATMADSMTPCAPGTTTASTIPGHGQPPKPPMPEIIAKDIDSHDILDRTETAPEVSVKHILLAWKELDEATYHGRIDKRAKDRTNEEAAKLAQDYLAQLKADPTKIDALVKEFSEDPGAKSGDPYVVKADTSFVPEFKKLALRLKEKEAGIVKTTFGYHVIERVAPPPPDPLESADILARPAEAGPVEVQHVLIGWKDVPAAKQRPLDPRAKDRTKEQADAIAKGILDKAKGGSDFAALMKETSEDPGSKDNARIYTIDGNTPMVEPFKNLSLRLKMGEVGLVKSPFGWHVIKRVPPPPPDVLESTDVLKREPPTAKVKVKHILLGWKDAHTSDPRGTARTRADLETLVKDTVAQLKKGDAIEPLMKKISEDPGSQDGKDYEVSPTAGMVPPFTNLSLRLKVGEVGVVKTDFGIHIIKRTE